MDIFIHDCNMLLDIKNVQVQNLALINMSLLPAISFLNLTSKTFLKKSICTMLKAKFITIFKHTLLKLHLDVNLNWVILILHEHMTTFYTTWMWGYLVVRNGLDGIIRVQANSPIFLVTPQQSIFIFIVCSWLNQRKICRQNKGLYIKQTNLLF